MLKRVVAWIALCLVLTGCHRRGPSPNVEGAARSVLVVAADMDIMTLDPAVAYEPTGVNLCMDLYDTLIRYEGDDFVHPLPGLATSWHCSADGLTWTFNLRHDARFSSGRPVTAMSVRDSLIRAIQLDQGPAWILKQNLAPERITAPDPYTLQLRLLKPSASFLSTLFNPVASPVDLDLVKQHPDYWLRDHSAGSGPFVLTRWEPDVAVTMARSPVHPEVPLRRVIVKDIKEPTMQQMMLDRGDADMAYDVPPLQIHALLQNPRVKVVPAPLLRVWYLGMNVSHKPFDNPKVRQAIRFAIDYDGIVRYLLKGRGKHVETPIVPGMAGYDPDLDVYRHDPDRARQLLRQAGYPDGFDMTLTSGSGSTELGPSVEDLCAKIQQDLGVVGIRVTVQNLSTTAYLDLYRGAKKLDMNLGYWGADYPDPEAMIQPFGHSGGTLAKRVNYSNPELDRLIDAGAREQDFNKRDALYKEAGRLLAEDGPWVILVQPQMGLPIRTEVQGFVWNPLSDMEFWRCHK